MPLLTTLPASSTKLVACRRTVMQQHAAPAARLSHRVVASAASTYFGQTLRPHIARGLQLSGSRCSRNLQPVQASVFGVGAPEAILVGVVALLVFGPKGLAQAAKSLGQTLRAFQPTIRELTQVSAELKSTLENEIGINEIKEELRRPASPQPRDGDAVAGTQGPALSELADEMTAKVQGVREDMAKVMDPDIERKRQESAKLAWGAGAVREPSAPAAAASGGGAGPAAAAAGGQVAAPLNTLSIEQLEAELQRRKAAASAGAQVPRELRADE